MPLRFTCPNKPCSKIWEVGDEHGGEHWQCPTCKTEMIIPTATASPPVISDQDDEHESGDTPEDTNNVLIILWVGFGCSCVLAFVGFFVWIVLTLIALPAAVVLLTLALKERDRIYDLDFTKRSIDKLVEAMQWFKGYLNYVRKRHAEKKANSPDRKKSVTVSSVVAIKEAPDETPIPASSTYKDIFEAAREGSVSGVRYFIENKGVKVNARDVFGNTPLNWVFLGYNLYRAKEVVEYLISKRANVNATDEFGQTPLHIVARKTSDNLELLKILIDAGANVNARDNVLHDSGKTPLIIAATHCENVKVLECLISAGAYVNTKDDSGWTPLHHAVQFNSVKVVKYLISKGADVNAKSNEGQSVLQAVDIPDKEEKRRIVQKAINREGRNCCFGCLIIIAIPIVLYFYWGEIVDYLKLEELIDYLRKL